MKKLINLALAGTMILAVLACQREPAGLNDVQETGVKEVTTQFVLNITSAPSTKQTADVVQLNENFRGIQDAYLFVYKTNIYDEDDATKIPYVLATDAVAEKTFNFDYFFAEGGLDNANNNGAVDDDGNIINNNNNNYTGDNSPGTVASKRILQLSIPVGVDAVMFYGKATKGDGSKSEDYGGTNEGSYTVSQTSKKYTVISDTPSNTIIAAQKILDTQAKVDQYDQTAALMITIINNILHQSVGASTVTIGGETTPVPPVSWADYGHKYENEKYPGTTRYGAGDTSIDHNLAGLEEVLGKCYYQFTYIKNGEYRAGSSAAVKQMIIDMYKIIYASANADPTTVDEANARRLAEVILDRAEVFFYSPTSTPPSGYSAGDFKPVETVHSLAVSNQVITEVDWTNYYSHAMELNKHPFQNIGIPEGAAQLGFVKNGDTHPASSPKKGQVATEDEFFYHHPNKPLVNPNMTEFEPRKYLYPAELWYYVNSPIRTNSNDVTVASYPDGVSKWNDDNTWTTAGWVSPGKVASDTRGVAVTCGINYGVALLKTAVKYTETTLQDNRKACTNNKEENRTINASAADLRLRGVLVGGVNPRMNWQFVRKYTAAGNYEGITDNNLSLFDGVIYDHSIPTNAVAVPSTGVSNPNYTIVYDNYNSSNGGDVAQQNDVYVALEFVNGGQAFYGRDNLIPQGGVFYLVGKLDKPSTIPEKVSALVWPEDHQIPPVYGVDTESVPAGKKAGQSKKIARVFIQDFMTTATFKIGELSLQNAYYSVPDLRASQMSLGLSVDLEWTQGIDYEVAL
ncbi:MAG: hypothetical protein J6X99_05515 [Bacteroidales bacterium]|nr:hypothetical protein [Bacteroidales bacterium]